MIDTEKLILDDMFEELKRQMDEATVRWIRYLWLLDLHGMDYEQQLLPRKV
jgi:hypothetical protein